MKVLTKDNVYELFNLFNTKHGEDPKKIPVHGFLKNILNNVIDYEVYVDSWPAYKTVVVKPRDSQGLPIYRVGIYSTDETMVKTMLCKPGFLPKQTTIRIYGLPMDLVSAIEDIATKLNFSVKVLSKEDPRKIITITASAALFDSIDTSDVLKEFQICTLDPNKHMNAILSMWMDHNGSDFFINKEEAITAIKYYISIGPSVGVVRKCDDKLLMWALSDVDLSGRMAIIIPEYRGHIATHYGGIEFVRQKIKYNDLHWGFIPIRNAASTALSQKAGCNFYHDVEFVHCILRPKDTYTCSRL